MFISQIVTGRDMATAKTGSFYLTETVMMTAAQANGTRNQGTIDLGAYINVATGQAIAIDQVDFVVQRDGDYGGSVANFLAGNGAVSYQLSDLNPEQHSLERTPSIDCIWIYLNRPDNNLATHTADIYPDNFGPSSLSESFMVGQ